MAVNDYQKIKVALLEEIQADRTTSEVSKELGFTFDKYKRWLDQSKILKWDEFCDVCEKNGLRLTLALEKIYFPTDDISDPKHFFAHLKQINGFQTNQEIADYLNVHVSVVKRYNHGETIPDFETIFNLIDYQENHLASFLYRLFPREIKNSLLKDLVAQGIKGSLFTGNQPIYPLIEAALNIEKYKNRSVNTLDWLSKQFELDQSQIKIYLEDMIKAGTIVKSGDDHYESTSNITNLQMSFAEAIPYYQSLNKMAIDYFEENKNTTATSSKPGIVAHRIYPASTESTAKIRSILIQADAEIRKVLLEDTTEAKEAFCMLLEVFPVTNKLA